MAMRKSLIIAATMLLTACGGADVERIVDAKGAPVTAQKLKTIEAGIAARDRRENRTAAQRRSDAILLNADFRRQIGKNDALTPLQRSAVVAATTGDKRDPAVRNQAMLSRVDAARKRLALMHIAGVRNDDKVEKNEGPQ